MKNVTLPVKKLPKLSLLLTELDKYLKNYTSIISRVLIKCTSLHMNVLASKSKDKGRFC